MTAISYPDLPAQTAEKRPPRPTPATEGLEWQAASRANWLWLVPMPSWNHAVEIAPATSRLPGALDQHFARVDRVNIDKAWRLAFDDASVDCIALHDSGNAVSTPAGASLLAECHRVLAPGGWLYFAINNHQSITRWHGSRLAWFKQLARDIVTRRSPARAMNLATDRAIEMAGFAHARRYFAAPSEAAQRILIPAERSAVIAQERLDRALSKNRPLRSVLANFGLYDALYPVRIVLCRR